jgi:hypothetical protein
MMRNLLHRFLIWVLGYKPLRSDGWTIVVKGDDHLSYMLVDENAYPPRSMIRPVVVAGVVGPDDFPTEAKQETLVRIYLDLDARAALYETLQS